MLSKELEKSLNGVAQEASLKRHEFVTVEHLLLALLNNDQAINVLVNVGADVEKLRAELEKYIDDTTPTLQMDDSERGTQTTLGFQRVIQRAIMHVQSTSNGKREVTGANVLVAIFGEKDSHAVYYLHQQGVSRLDIVNFIAHGISKTQPNVNVGEEGAVENDTQKAGSQLHQTISGSKDSIYPMVSHHGDYYAILITIPNGLGFLFQAV